MIVPFVLFLVVLASLTPDLLSATLSNDDKNVQEEVKHISDCTNPFPFSDIIISDIKGGLNLSITFVNQGNYNFPNIVIEIKIINGYIVKNREKQYNITLNPSPTPGSTCTIQHSLFGIGITKKNHPQLSIYINISNKLYLMGQIEISLIGTVIKIIHSMLNEDIISPGYILFTPEFGTDTYLIDHLGNLVHTWKGKYIQGMATYLLENGNMLRTDLSVLIPSELVIIGGYTTHIGEYDPQGDCVWEFEYFSDNYTLHHDIEPLPNGNIILTACEYKSEIDIIQAGGNPYLFNSSGKTPPTFSLVSDYLIEIKPNGTTGGEIVWEWHVWDHLIQDYDPTKENYGDVEKHPELIHLNHENVYPYDFTHINSVDYNEEFDQILLSVRHFNEIWIIDHSTTSEEATGHTGGRYEKGGDLLYRWGNPQVYSAGTESDQQLFLQHDASWIESGAPGEGNILFYNNAKYKEGLYVYSAVEEIVPPCTKDGIYYKIGKAYGPNLPIWSYKVKDEATTLSPNQLSSAQRLPNGNTLICYGQLGKFYEITPLKEIVWQYTNPYGIDNRVFKIRKYLPDYPGIKILLQNKP